MINVAKKTPTKTPRRRSASRVHAACSEKRTLLKQRIVKVSNQVMELTDELSLTQLRLDILGDVLKSVIEALDLSAVLDPFGASLSPAEEGKPNGSPPT